VPGEADSELPHADDDRLAALSQRVKRLRRRVLDPDVLRGQLPLRWPLVQRIAARPESSVRERRFLDVSSSYAEAVSEQSPATGLADARRTFLDGLAWWVPLTAPDDAALVEKALRHQDFPYRAITQTRDVALGGIMLDIGANIGRMTVPRVILGDVTVAYCAEPDPLNYRCLVRNVRDNGLAGLVLPDNLAIGAVNGNARLVKAKSAGGHRVIDDAAQVRGEVIDVPMLTLDTWIERLGVDPGDVRFIKVDVQGSEVDVLDGAAAVLACRHIAWQIEVDLGTLATRGLAGRDLIGRIQPHFSHFVDLNRLLTTLRVRPIADLAPALEYVSGGSDGRTDIVLFSVAQGPIPGV